MKTKIIKHPSMGHLCGYVRIPRGHPLYRIITSKVWTHKWPSNKYVAQRRGYNHYLIEQLEVHGGITFAGKLRNTRGIWIGFDCAHLGDLVPAMSHLSISIGEPCTYKDEAFVTAELAKLIDQLTQSY